jgi:hypothetical protein
MAKLDMERSMDSPAEERAESRPPGRSLGGSSIAGASSSGAPPVKGLGAKIISALRMRRNLGALRSRRRM